MQPGTVRGEQLDQFNTSATGLTLVIDFGNSTIWTFEELEGNDVHDVTESAVTVEADWYGDSVFITSIAGVPNDSDAGLWWQFWVNGELGSTAANKYNVEDGDTIEWKRIAPQTETETTTNSDTDTNYDILFGALTLTIIGVGFLVFLFIKMR